MANPNAPYGLKTVRHYMNGVMPRENRYFIDSGAGSIYYGDPVKTDTVNRAKKIVAAAAGDRWLGKFCGCTYVDSTGATKFSKAWISGTGILAGSQITAHVEDDPGTLFEIQCSGAFTAADIGKSANFVAGAGSATTGLSGFQLDYSTVHATNQQQLKIVDYVQDDPANALGNYCRLLVLNSKMELGAQYTPV